MSANARSRAEALDEFLLDYLPYGADQDDHDLLVAMLEAARKRIAGELRVCGELMVEDEEEMPMRDEAALRAREYAAGRGEDQSDGGTRRGPLRDC
jgi:hypothetical protein